MKAFIKKANKYYYYMELSFAFDTQIRLGYAVYNISHPSKLKPIGPYGNLMYTPFYFVHIQNKMYSPLNWMLIVLIDKEPIRLFILTVITSLSKKL
jgi:hypothetical protein